RAVAGTMRACPGVTWGSVRGVGLRAAERRVRQKNRLRRHLRRLLDHTLRGMSDVHHDAETIARTDHVRAKGREAVVNDGAGLEIADVVRRVVHELHGPDAAAVRLLEPL